MKKPVTIITGGTGLIGSALSQSLLEKGHEVIILSRSGEQKKPAQEGLRYAHWDIEKKEIEESAIRSADHIVHLAGANVAGKRWTAARKKEIFESRTKSGELLVKALREIPNKVQSLASASAIGYYGPDPEIPNPHPFREEFPPSSNFLADTCVAWENSIDPVTDLGIRLVKIRTGIVLSETGGAMDEFVKPLKFGIATILGTGRQMVSWIHMDDLLRIYTRAISDTSMRGVYNAVAPQPVSNKKLVLSLANWKRGNMYISVYVPAFALKLVLGEMSIEVLKSATVSCNKLHVEGFTFVHPSLESAIAAFSSKKS